MEHKGGEIMSSGGVFVPQVGAEDHPSNRVSCSFEVEEKSALETIKIKKTKGEKNS